MNETRIGLNLEFNLILSKYLINPEKIIVNIIIIKIEKNAILQNFKIVILFFSGKNKK